MAIVSFWPGPLSRMSSTTPTTVPDPIWGHPELCPLSDGVLAGPNGVGQALGQEDIPRRISAVGHRFVGQIVSLYD